MSLDVETVRAIGEYIVAPVLGVLVLYWVLRS
jgi:hypothetical protein